MANQKGNIISAPDTYDNLLEKLTLEYLEQYKKQPMPNDAKIQSELLEKIREAFNIRNAGVDKTDRWAIPKRLVPTQIAMVMSKKYNIYKVITNPTTIDPDNDVLAIYENTGYNKGTYTKSEDTFRKVARRFCFTLSSKEFIEVMVALRDIVDSKERETNRDLIAVNNGIFNYQTKQLEPFDPEKVFLVKSHVNYNPNAKNIVIHNPNDKTDWDVESWMNELSDDPEVVQLLWEILGAVIRPNVSWNKSAWLYSQEGNNGKGTLCHLMRQLIGAGAWASIPLDRFGKQFALAPLFNASAIIVDENAVDAYIDKSDDLKAVSTNDVINIEKKGKDVFAYQFFGFMVQCLNGYPKVKDKSDSFYRRQLFIPMEKSFEGIERKYIKSDYLKRKEVLEYVLYRVLHSNYYELSIPKVCKEALEEYKEYNDPILQFFTEIESQVVWDLLPFSFLYDLYKGWMTQNNPKGLIVGRNKFIEDIVFISKKSENWYCTDKRKKIRTKNRMDKPEPLIGKYDAKNWMSQTYQGDKDLAKKYTPTLNDSSTERGLLRKTITISSIQNDEDEVNNDTKTEIKERR